MKSTVDIFVDFLISIGIFSSIRKINSILESFKENINQKVPSSFEILKTSFEDGFTLSTVQKIKLHIVIKKLKKEYEVTKTVESVQTEIKKIKKGPNC